MRAIAGRVAAVAALAATLAALPTQSVATGTPPAVTTGSSASVGSTSAQVAGTVNPNGSATTYSFQYGATTAYGSQTASVSAGSGTAAVAVSATIGGLVPDTTYHYRLVASNGSGTANGTDGTFTTAKTPPVVVTGGASAVTATQAVLNATVNPQGKATSYQFQYGTSSAYGLQTPATSAGSGTAPLAVKATVNGLVPGVTYHFRAIATNPDGTATGVDASFATVARAPAVTTSATTVVSADSAVLTGAVNPNGRLTSYAFQYGPTDAYGSQTAYAAAGAGTASVHVAVPISGLAAGTAYHYRLIASSSAGATSGADAGFVTTAAAVPAGAPLPAVSQAAAVAITPSGAQLNGAINPPASRTTWWFEYGLTGAYGMQTASQTMTGLGARPINVRLAGLAPATTFHFRLLAQTATTLYVGPDNVFATKPLARLRPLGVTLTATATPGARGPVIAVSGTLQLPPALAPQAVCNGVVEIAIARSGAIVSLRSVPLSPTCAYSEQVGLARSRLRGVRRLGVAVHFTGNALLTPTVVARTSVRP
jgi:phosphodiesterase/alkaline phosphatase D-like protein